MLQGYIDAIYEVIRKDVEERMSNGPTVKVLNIITNPNDAASEIYTNAKKKNCESFGIKYEKVFETNIGKLKKIIEMANENNEITSIILQLPLAPELAKYERELLEMISSKKDIDRLKKEWYYDADEYNLPITAKGMFMVIQMIMHDRNIMDPKILLIGNGKTTNRNLFLYLFDKGYQVVVTNSKTDKERVSDEIAKADIIISATGRPGSLHDKNLVDKYIISPTIFKDKISGVSMTDLRPDYKDSNYTHKVFGAIGKLTTILLCQRAYQDAE